MKENLKETILITLFVVVSVGNYKTATAISSPWMVEPEGKASH